MPTSARCAETGTTLDRPVVDLDGATCWRLLRSEELGRLAFRLVDEVHLLPVNYVVDGESLLIRTAPGSKLLAGALESPVAFEIDCHDEGQAWSVVARGRLRRLEEDEQHRLDDRAEQPWVPTRKDEVLELRPIVLTGRRFLLER